MQKANKFFGSPFTGPTIGKTILGTLPGVSPSTSLGLIGNAVGKSTEF